MLNIHDIVEMADQAYPTGLEDVYDFDQKVAKLGLVKDRAKAMVVHVIRSHVESRDNEPDVNVLSHIAAELEQATINIGEVVDKLIREAHARTPGQ